MLHGRAADGAIMERLLTALKWTTLPLDFVTVTALHPCEPIPGLYPDAIKFANGTFDWGLLLPNSPERDACVKQSIEDIEQIIAKDPNRLDGIGGICDGSLIASLVVARQPVNSPLSFYINMCGGPWSMLPKPLQTDKTVNVPSVHLIGKKDETFTWEQLRSIPEKCANPLIAFHSAGHAVPMVNDSIADAVMSTLRRADLLAATKALSPGLLPAKTDESSDAALNGVAGGRLTTVTAGIPRAKHPQGAADLEYDSLELVAPKEPPKKKALAHLTGLRGFFIMLVVLDHFIPRPSENIGQINFVDQIDVSKGWYVQDLANIMLDRIPGFAMPYLFVASGFGVHLTYRKRTYKLFDFYLDRLTRMALIFWLLVVIEFCIDRLLPKDMKPHFQPERIPTWHYLFNTLTLGTVRPLLIQAHNLIFFEYPWPLTSIEPTTSPKFNEWLNDNTLMISTIMHLWFLTYTVICMTLYPIIAKAVQIIDRYGGVFGLSLATLLWSAIAVIPMVVDAGEVHLFFKGAMWYDALTWEETHAHMSANRTDDIWTDQPYDYDHHVVPDGPVWSSHLGLRKSPVGKRVYLMHYDQGPRYRLPWFLNESSVTWPMAFILYFACGVATVTIMTRLEEWSRTVDGETEHQQASKDEAKDKRKAKRVATERTPLKDAATSYSQDEEFFDIESGGVASSPRPESKLTKLFSRFRELFVALRKACMSHEGRGLLADLCILSIVIPSFLQPLDYKKYRDNYFPRNNGYGDISNWSKAYTPIYCLFLYGSASQGGAGFFAALFSSEALVNLGEISLAVYALQATLARCCAVRWFLRGPNAENYCKDLDDYFADMPGRLTNEVNATGEDLNDAEVAYLSSSKIQCLDTTGDLIALYIVVLLIVGSFVTYKVEPFLDEKFRSGISYLRNTPLVEMVVSLRMGRDYCISNFKALCSVLGFSPDSRSPTANENVLSHENVLRHRAERLRHAMLGWIKKRRERNKSSGDQLIGDERETLLSHTGQKRGVMRL